MLQISASLSRDHQQLLERMGHDLGRVSRVLTRKLALDVVAEMVDVHRVDTGRARMGWVALMRLHGVPVSEYGGRRRANAPQRTPQEVAAARAEGERAGRATEREEFRSFTVTVENPVDYVPHLDARYPFILPAIRTVLSRWRAEVDEAMRTLGMRGR